MSGSCREGSDRSARGIECIPSFDILTGTVRVLRYIPAHTAGVVVVDRSYCYSSSCSRRINSI